MQQAAKLLDEVVVRGDARALVEEALEKMRNGEWIMVREGTASRNLLGLLPMFSDQYYNRALLVTDDKHPGDLITDGHIDHIIRTAIILNTIIPNIIPIMNHKSDFVLTVASDTSISSTSPRTVFPIFIISNPPITGFPI